MNIEEMSVNAIRVLSADAIQKANSGHPGLPLGTAPTAYELWTNHMNYNPADPEWENRDRFVLSGGHGSMLLYSLFHLLGIGNLSLDDVDNEQTETTTKSDDEGNYEIYVIPGKYDFYAERQGFLADITSKITINENDEIDLGTKILYEGDADRSGIIDLNDTIEIVNSMGASKGDSIYSEKYDFGQKGYVSLDDMVSVVGNLYKTIKIKKYTG